MMGNDVERILSNINNIKDVTENCIKSLSNATAYRLEVYPDSHLEKEKPSSASSYVDPINSALSSFNEDIDKMNNLSSTMYIDVKQFNNGYGSPWEEITKLKDSIKSAVDYGSSHSNLDWLGEKTGLLSMLNIILGYTIDAKWAIIYYHDYIQRGYDNVYNNNIPSIKFPDSLDKDTIGNIDQKYDENVNIPPKSIDPF